MWNDNLREAGMMDWSMSGWHWMMSLNGIISIVSVAIIIFASAALIRDWRLERIRRDAEGPHEHDLSEIHPPTKTKPEKHRVSNS